MDAAAVPPSGSHPHDGEHHQRTLVSGSKWRILADKVLPTGLHVGLEAASHLAAMNILTRVLSKPVRERTDADVRYGTSSPAHATAVAEQLVELLPTASRRRLGSGVGASQRW